MTGHGRTRAAALAAALFLGLAGVPLPVAAADMWKPTYMWGADIDSPSVRARMQRHWTYMYNGVPERFRNARPPRPATLKRIAEGRDIYARDCAGCHRMDGMGGGDAALGLAPSPALLSYLIQRPGAADEYLLWTVADGGRLFGTGMPEYASRLATDDIWKVVAFMRAGFPPDAAEGPARTPPVPTRKPEPPPR
ncbi:MAG: cytochrome c [Rhodospirillaceae bacterium]